MRPRSPLARAVVLALLLVLLPVATGRGEPPPLRLRIEAPPQLVEPAAALRAAAVEPWDDELALVGLADPGPPIRVLVVPESDPLAARTPRWITGFAVAERNAVVVFPERVLSYPYDSLEGLLRHEITHVLLARATGGASLPRWFHEGVAMLAAHDWRLGDDERLLVGGVRGVPPSTRDLERAFAGEGYDVDTAYAIAGALVKELVRRHGRGAVARIAREVAAGRPFASAFAAATGEPLERFEAAFWRRFQWLYRWVPFLTSGATGWLAVTGLALLAMVRRRQRDAALRRRWQDEEDAAAEGLRAATAEAERVAALDASADDELVN